MIRLTALALAVLSAAALTAQENQSAPQTAEPSRPQQAEPPRSSSASEQAPAANEKAPAQEPKPRESAKPPSEPAPAEVEPPQAKPPAPAQPAEGAKPAEPFPAPAQAAPAEAAPAAPAPPRELQPAEPAKPKVEPAAAVPAKPEPANAIELEVKATPPWLDTGLDLSAGELFKVTASGALKFAGRRNTVAEANPRGLARDWRDLLRTYPVNSAGKGALIGRIGNSSAVRPFLVGDSYEGRAAVKGRLFLGLNNAGSDAPEGVFKVRIERTAPAPAVVQPVPVATVPAAPIAKFAQELLDKIPPRVKGADGTPGDRVNFIIIGSRQQVQDALKAAGWLTTDANVQTAVFQSILDTLSRRSYVTMPMSELMLFDRVQDFGYAQADPIKVVASRHHFRLWQAPFDFEGRTVWAGAGTHDVGFDRDQRNNKVTHRIDPEVDKERDYIGESLMHTGMVAKTEYMTPKDPIREAKTAHGQAFFSDGRTLVIYLTPEAAAPAQPQSAPAPPTAQPVALPKLP